MIPDPSPPFEFEPSGAILERLGLLLTAAQQRGVLPEATAAFREIIRRLTDEPRDWGDPIHDRRHAQVTLYDGHH